MGALHVEEPNLRALACVAIYGYHHVRWSSMVAYTCWRCAMPQSESVGYAPTIIQYVGTDRWPKYVDAVPVGFPLHFEQCSTVADAEAYLRGAAQRGEKVGT